MPISPAQALASLKASQAQATEFAYEKGELDKQTMYKQTVIEDGVKQAAHIRGISQEGTALVYNKAR